jgi:hypothetical protein
VKWPIADGGETFFGDTYPGSKKHLYIGAVKGTQIPELGDLSIFFGYWPGLSYEEVVRRYGVPSSTRTSEQGKIAVYVINLIPHNIAVEVHVSEACPGAIKLDGKEYPIKYSYALAVGQEYCLILTDVPLPEKTFDGPSGVLSLSTDGKTHGLSMTLDSKGNPNPIRVLQVAAVTSDLSWQQLEFSKLSKELLEEKTSTKSVQKLNDKTYEYNISFKTPVNVITH